jgi:uncharacterized protein YndB with AHSA1/START domain
VTDIELDQFIAREPAAVWRALTEPEALARWWAAGDIKPIVGHRFTLDMGPRGQQQEGSDALKGMGNGWPALLRRLEPSLP